MEKKRFPSQCPEKYKEYDLRKRTINPEAYWFNRQYAQGRSSARIRGIDWNLTKDQFRRLRFHVPCAYCGGGLPQTGCGLDRKNSDLPYSEENVVPCCGVCNKAKGAGLSFEEMQLIWEHRRAQAAIKKAG